MKKAKVEFIIVFLVCFMFYFLSTPELMFYRTCIPAFLAIIIISAIIVRIKDKISFHIHRH